MAFGKRIKLFRTLCGMKQRQVGEILGFNGAATEVRMAQYEAEAREPKAALVEQMDLF
jgi:transcriptional regulator with XRE-family HTH domain